jgi:hypothetical protein
MASHQTKSRRLAELRTMCSVRAQSCPFCTTQTHHDASHRGASKESLSPCKSRK